MPPSWLEVIDHFATRTSAEDKQEGVEEEQAHETWADEKINMELEKREVVVIKGEYSEGGFEGRLSNRSVIELKEGRFSAGGGGKWGGQMHGRGAGIVEETLVQKELKIWSALQVLFLQQRTFTPHSHIKHSHIKHSHAICVGIALLCRRLLIFVDRCRVRMGRRRGGGGK
jgi:hypothetical protein